MTYALIAAGSYALGSPTASPTYGATPTAGNLLVCLAQGGANIVTISGTGWLTAAAAVSPTVNSSSISAGIFYKTATGGDAAPTVTDAAGSIGAILAEFSGNSASPLDRTGTGNLTTSPQAVSTSGTDATSAELVLFSWIEALSAAVAVTITHTLNNGATPTVLFDDHTNSSNFSHVSCGYAITTGNAAADQDSVSFTTTNLNVAELAVASFKLAGGAPFTPSRAPLGL